MVDIELPDIENRVEAVFIDATPQGYALRILRFYRERCDERWAIHSLSKEEAIIYDLMNQAQVERAKELDKAIAAL